MKALDTKLLRELWQLRMQMLSIALVVAAGVMSVVTMRGSYEALVSAQRNYYEKSAFADIWSSLVRAPQFLTERIARIDGVQAVDTRVTFIATLDLPDVALPALGRFVSVPDDERPLLNDINIRAGRYIAPGAGREVIISEKFAQARALRPGHTVTAVINGRALTLDVVGIANSPEHSYAVPPGSILPENDRYGIFWMSRDVLGPAYNMDSAFNEVVLALDEAANPEAVQAQLDALLEPYGGLGSYPRADQVSHLVLDNELGQIRITGTVIPAIFLIVAMFLLHQVMNRLITTQRNEIAVLKAFGYSNRRTGWHFLNFALLAVLAGAVAGGIGGFYFGRLMVSMYAHYFEIPDLAYRVTPSLLFIATGLSLVGAASGALSAVYRAIRLPPAEAMRPRAPASYRPGLLERAGLGARLSPATKFILRNLERKPLHFLMSVTGIACALSILVIGMFFFDSMDVMLDTQFRKIQREDLTITFREDVDARVRFDLQHLPGVRLLETYRQVPARLRHGHLREETAVTGLAPDSRLRRIVNGNGDPVPFPAAGMVLSRLLADKLQVDRGDWLHVEWLDGKRLQRRIRVTGTTDDYLGLSAWMSAPALARDTGEGLLVSGAWMLTDADERAALYARLKAAPLVAGISSPTSMLAAFNEEMARSILATAAFLLGFAGILAFGVIYNSARIALSERARELASLRVMGFHKRETSRMLLGEQWLITLTALLPGCLLGYLMAMGLATALENDTYRIPLVIKAQSYLLSCTAIVLAAFVSMIAIGKRLNRFELVTVLKTRE